MYNNNANYYTHPDTFDFFGITYTYNGLFDYFNSTIPNAQTFNNNIPQKVEIYNNPVVKEEKINEEKIIFENKEPITLKSIIEDEQVVEQIKEEPQTSEIVIKDSSINIRPQQGSMFARRYK